MVYEKKLLAKDLQAGNATTKTADADLADDALSFNEETAGRLTSAQLLEQIEIRRQRADEELSHQTLRQRLLYSSIPVRIPPSLLVTCLGVFAAFSGILSGFDQSIISGATHGVQHHFASGPNPAWHWADAEETTLDSHSASQWSLVSSLMPLGAMAGSLMIDPLHSVFGRRGSILQSCLWYTLGAGLCAGCRSVGMLYAGRFILGVGVGIEGGSVGIYIGESVPKEVRGSLVSVYQLCIALGEVFGYACGGIFFDVHSGSWRYMLGSSVLFSTILLVGLLFMPESPRWLNQKGMNGRAFRVWTMLRDMDNPDSMVEWMVMEHTSAVEADRAAHEKWYERFFELVVIPRNRRALVYGTIMVFLGQMTGINAIMYNMSKLMSAINFNPKQSVLMSMVGGGSLLLGTIPAVLWMDRFGRRVWAQNILGFIVGLVLVGVGYLYSPGSTSQEDFEAHKSLALGLFFTGLILYMGFFGTYSCLTWVVPAESFAIRTRSQGMAVCSTGLYLWSFIVTYNFEGMVNAMKYTGLTIGFFGGLAVLGFFYQLFFMPETSNKTLEEIDALFEMPTRQLVALNMRNLGRTFPRLFGKYVGPQNHAEDLAPAVDAMSPTESSQITPMKEH